MFNFSEISKRLAKAKRLADKENQYLKAFEIINEILQDHPRHEEALLTRARLNFVQNNLKKTMEDLKHLNQINPFNVDLWRTLAEIYHKTNSFPQVHKSYRRILELVPNDPEPLVNLATYYLEQKQLDQTLQLIDEAKRVDISFYGINYLEARIAKNQKQWDKAIELYTKVIEKKSDFLSVYEKIATCFYEKKDYAKMEGFIHKGVEVAERLNSGSPELYSLPTNYSLKQKLKIVHVYMNNNMYVDAERVLLPLLDDQHLPDPYCEMGNIYYAKNDIVKAAKYFDLALKKDNTHSKSLNNLGFIKYLEKKYPEARKYLERSVKADPKNFEAWHTLGLLNLLDSDIAKAIISYEAADLHMPEKHPMKRDMLRKLFGCYVETDQVEKGEKLSQRLKQYGILTRSLKYPGKVNFDL